MDEKYMTEKQLGSALGISRSTLNKLRSQDLPYLRIGDSVRYRQSDVEAWLNAQHHVGKNTEEK